MQISFFATAAEPSTARLVAELVRMVPLRFLRSRDLALEVVASRKQLTASELASSLGLRPWAAYRLLSELVASGQAERMGRSPDARDRRRGAGVVRATQAGDAAATAVRDRLACAGVLRSDTELAGGNRRARAVVSVLAHTSSIRSRILVSLRTRPMTYGEIREAILGKERSVRAAVRGLRHRDLVERQVVADPITGAYFRFRLTSLGHDAAAQILSTIDRDLRANAVADTISAACAG